MKVGQQEVFKVFARVPDTEELRSYCYTFPGSPLAKAALIYKPNEWNESEHGFPLTAFNNAFDALEFAGYIPLLPEEFYPGAYILSVWRCLAEDVTPFSKRHLLDPWLLNPTRTQNYNITDLLSAFWNGTPTDTPLRINFLKAPPGSVTCSRVKLIEEI